MPKRLSPKQPIQIEKAPKEIKMAVARLEDLERLNPIIKEMLLDAKKAGEVGAMARFSLDFSLSF
ncbi:MAG: hypothetical protein ACOY93_08790 [Bacillota bacterium]